MITFVTLFLSLVHGIHPVQVAVDGSVARVEIVLDERRVTTLTRPPWSTSCDFGLPLAPHELEAVAYDAEGDRLGVARQLVNLPRPPAEVGIALESDAGGPPARARVFWEAAVPADALAVQVTLDGRPLTADEQGGYPLPTCDPERAHIVNAEVQLPDGVEANAAASFGGPYGSRASSELTAVPILCRRRPPDLARLEGAVLVDGGEASVVAVERLGARVYLVRDERALRDLARVLRRGAVAGQRFGLSRDQVSRSLDPARDRFHIVLTRPLIRKGRGLFRTSAGSNLVYRDWSWLGATFTADAEAGGRQQLADAVAVAGVHAAGRGAPRAVVLLVSGAVQDYSTFGPVEVRSFLEALRVPLYVWSTAGEDAGWWGPAVDVSRPEGVARAVKRLKRDLGRQWIVWIKGTPMINHVELAAGARGVTLAGAPPTP